MQIANKDFNKCPCCPCHSELFYNNYDSSSQKQHNHQILKPRYKNSNQNQQQKQNFKIFKKKKSNNHSNNNSNSNRNKINNNNNKLSSLSTYVLQHNSKQYQKCCCQEGRTLSNNKSVNRSRSQSRKSSNNYSTINSYIQQNQPTLNNEYRRKHTIDHNNDNSSINMIKKKNSSYQNKNKIKQEYPMVFICQEQNLNSNNQNEDISNLSNIQNITNMIKLSSQSNTEKNQSKSQLNYSIQCKENTILSDKLYKSNKTLQQIILKYDLLSKTNHQLNQKNHQIQLQLARQKMQNQALREENLRLSKKNKKLSLKNQNNNVGNQNKNFQNSHEYKKLLQLNIQLQSQLKIIKQQRYKLKQGLQFAIKERQKYLQKSNLQNSEISQQWVAHTSEKLSKIQQNISKIQQKSSYKNIKEIKYKSKSQRPKKFALHSSSQNNIESQSIYAYGQQQQYPSSQITQSPQKSSQFESSSEAQQTARLGNNSAKSQKQKSKQNIKQQKENNIQIKRVLGTIMLTLNKKLSLNNTSNNNKFINVSSQQQFSRTILNNIQSFDIISIVKTIISGLIQSLISKCYQFEKQIERKVDIVYKKIIFLPKKLQNLSILMMNQKLIDEGCRSRCASVTRSAIDYNFSIKDDIKKNKHLDKQNRNQINSYFNGQNKNQNIKKISSTSLNQSPRCSFNNKNMLRSKNF